jgi:hypothetical protein
MNFHEKKEKYMNIMYEYQYIFEIKKCCEYTEWITVYKNMTIDDLYNNLYIQFHSQNKNKLFLYIMNENGEKKLLNRSDENLKDYIRNNQNYFKPIYPLPHWIVYSLYLDDGSCHKDHSLTEMNTCCSIHNNSS